MKNIFNVVLAALLILMPVRLLAHSDHGSWEPVTGEQAAGKAGQLVKTLVGNKKLSESWLKAKPAPVASRDTQYGPVWVVTFQNPEEKEKDKQTLYVFMDEAGEPIAANHEGKLE